MSFSGFGLNYQSRVRCFSDNKGQTKVSRAVNGAETPVLVLGRRAAGHHDGIWFSQRSSAEISRSGWLLLLFISYVSLLISVMGLTRMVRVV